MLRHAELAVGTDPKSPRFELLRDRLSQHCTQALNTEAGYVSTLSGPEIIRLFAAVERLVEHTDPLEPFKLAITKRLIAYLDEIDAIKTPPQELDEVSNALGAWWGAREEGGLKGDMVPPREFFDLFIACQRIKPLLKEPATPFLEAQAEVFQFKFQFVNLSTYNRLHEAFGGKQGVGGNDLFLEAVQHYDPNRMSNLKHDLLRELESGLEDQSVDRVSKGVDTLRTFYETLPKGEGSRYKTFEAFLEVFLDKTGSGGVPTATKIAEACIRDTGALRDARLATGHKSEGEQTVELICKIAQKTAPDRWRGFLGRDAVVRPLMGGKAWSSEVDRHFTRLLQDPAVSAKDRERVKFCLKFLKALEKDVYASDKLFQFQAESLLKMLGKLDPEDRLLPRNGENFHTFDVRALNSGSRSERASAIKGLCEVPKKKVMDELINLGAKLYRE